MHRHALVHVRLVRHTRLLRDDARVRGGYVLVHRDGVSLQRLRLLGARVPRRRLHLRHRLRPVRGHSDPLRFPYELDDLHQPLGLPLVDELLHGHSDAVHADHLFGHLRRYVRLHVGKHFVYRHSDTVRGDHLFDHVQQLAPLQLVEHGVHRHSDAVSGAHVNHLYDAGLRLVLDDLHRHPDSVRAAFAHGVHRRRRVQSGNVLSRARSPTSK